MNQDFVVTLIAGIIAIAAGIYIGVNITRDNAVESGAACYYVDQDHNKAFKWGDCE